MTALIVTGLIFRVEYSGLKVGMDIFANLEISMQHFFRINSYHAAGYRYVQNRHHGLES